MGKDTILNGEVLVCAHSAKWIKLVCEEFGLSEREAVGRIVNGYVHSWHQQFEIPLAAPNWELGAAIRSRRA